MATLQQGESTPLHVEGTCSVLSVHRRSSTILLLDKIDPVDPDNNNDKGKLYLRTSRLNSKDFSAYYHLAENLAAENQILCAIALESYDAFLLLVNAPGCRQALFFSLELTLITNCILNYVHDSVVKPLTVMACADVDQRRKDLTIGTMTGRVLSFAVRMIDKAPNQTGGRIVKPVMTFQAIQRAKAKLDTSTGKYAVHLVAMDLTGSTLVLYDTGSVQCLETRSLEPLWTVSHRLFRHKPVNIWGDKFGSHFVLYCKADLAAGNSMLEYWVPPDNYTLCMSGSFYRSCLPLSESTAVSSVCIESVAEEKTHLLLRESSGRIQLWRPEGNLFVPICALAPAQLQAPSSSSAIILFKEPSTSLTSKIAILVADGGQALEIALHYPSASDEQWLRLGKELEIAYLDPRVDEASVPHNQSIDAFLKPTVAADNDVRRVTSSVSPLHTVRVDEASVPSFNDDDSFASVDAAFEIEDLAVLDSSAGVVVDGISAESLSKSQGSTRPSTYDPTTARRPPSPDYTLLDKDPEDEIVMKDVLSDPVDIKPPEAFYYIPNSITSDRRSGEGNLVLTRKPTLYVRDTPTSVETMKLVSIKGFRPVDNLTPLGAVPDIQLVGVAVRAKMMTVVTSLRETFVFSFASDNQTCLPLRLELPLLHKEPVTSCVVADVVLSANSSPSSSSSSSSAQKTSKVKVIVPNDVSGQYAISFVGDTAGNIFFAISTTAKLYQVGSWKAHSSPIVAICTTGDCCRFAWRIAVSTVEGTSMVFPSSYAGSSVITIDKDGEVKVWQPVFSSGGKSSGCRQEDLFIGFHVSWKTAGLFSVVEAVPRLAPNTIVSSLAIDPSCMYMIIGFSDGNLSQFPIPGAVPSGSAAVVVCRSPSWFESRHTGSVDSVRVFCRLAESHNGIPVYSNNTSSTVNYALLEKGGGFNVGYTLPELRSLVEASSLVTSSADSSLGLWRFIIKSASEDGLYSSNNRYLAPVFCRKIVLSGYPQLGICTEIIEDVWSLSSIINGVVVTALIGTKSKVFTASRDNLEICTEIVIAETPSVSVPTLPVVANVAKPLQVAELMPMRQPNGMYSWLTLNDWATEEVATLPQHFAFDESEEKFILQDPAKGADENDIAPNTSRATSATTSKKKANIVEVEFTDEVEECDDSMVLLNGVYVRPTEEKPIEVMKTEFNPSRYKVDHILTESDRSPSPRQLRKSFVEMGDDFVWSDDISSAASDPGELFKSRNARRSSPNNDESRRKKKEEFVIDLTLSPTIPGLSLNSYIESMRAMTIIVDPPSPDEKVPQQTVTDIDLGGAAMTKSANLRMKKNAEITKRFKLFDSDEPKVKYLSKSASLSSIPTSTSGDNQKKKIPGVPLIGMPKEFAPVVSKTLFVKKANAPKIVVEKFIEAPTPLVIPSNVPKVIQSVGDIPVAVSEPLSIFTDTVPENTDKVQKSGVSSSYALPPNYFDRNAKPIVVSRKPKDFSVGTKYKTKVFRLH